jgi:hypothetical protein
MDKEQLLDRLWDLSVTAGMNQRLHQYDMSWYGWAEDVNKISVAILAAVAFGIAVFAALSTGRGAERARRRWDWASIASAFIALGSAIVLNVLSPGESEVHHADLFRRWSDLRREVDGLSNQVENASGSDVPATTFERYRDLLARKTDINTLESVEDSTRLGHFLDAEERSRLERAEDKKKPDKSSTAYFNSQ